MMNAIEVKNLSVSFENFHLKNVSFHLPTGMIVGFVGENGAGKTTTLKALLNLIHHQADEITILGKDAVKDELEIKNNIGVVLDDIFFYQELTPREISKVCRGIFKNWDSNYFANYLASLNIPMKQKINTFSKGMLAQVKIITALAHHPKLLILDEPTSGLDPAARDDILGILQDFVADENCSVLFSSHITTDIEKIADYVVFIKNGEILMEIEKDILLDRYGILKCSLQDAKDLSDFPYLYHRTTPYYEEYLIEDRRTFLKEYPDLTVERPSIEEIMILMKKGTPKSKEESPCYL